MIGLRAAEGLAIGLTRIILQLGDSEMVKIFRVELSLLAWAMVFAAVGFYLMGRSARAAETVVSPVKLLSLSHQVDLNEIQFKKIAQTQSYLKDVKSEQPR